MNSPFSTNLSRRLPMVASLLIGMFFASSDFAREKWPKPDEKTKKAMDEIKAREDAYRVRIEAELASNPIPGKPYIPGAAQPQDLPQAKIPVFPGAEGAGKYSFGGRGGKIFVVTTLDDSGVGSFREACESAGPRIIVFNVAGIIHLKHPLHIIAPYCTIAGQSAPGDGVCIAGRTTHIDTHDVVIRYMRFRRGQANVFDRDDSLGGHPVGNIMLDHLSCSWGFDENMSLYRHMYDAHDGKPARKLPTVNITIQWSITSEALDTFNHAFGGTLGGANNTIHHNLFASNTGRNPSIGMGGDFNFVNNVLFNWRHRTADGGDETTTANIINNYLKPGPAANDNGVKFRIIQPAAAKMDAAAKQAVKDGKPLPPRFGKLYVNGNIVEGFEKITADNWDGGVQFRLSESEDTAAKALSDDVTGTLRAQTKVDKPFPMAPVETTSAAEAFTAVLANSGATLPRRDPVDLRIVTEVKTGKPTFAEGQGIITDISQIGGYPEYKGAAHSDLGKDGIPNWWKKKYNLDLNDPNLANKDTNGDGYTNIEKFLSGIDPVAKKIDYNESQFNKNTLTLEKVFHSEK